MTDKLKPIRDLELQLSIKLRQGSDSDLSSYQNSYTLKGGEIVSLSLANVGRAKDVYFLNQFPHLKRLNLSKTGIKNLAPLASLSQLSYLNLERNNIADLVPLASLSQLSFLYLGNNKITDLEPLASLSQLTTLDLRNNQIESLRPLTSLSQLSKLYLAGNQIDDVAPLASLSKLSYLDLDSNRITNLTSLSSLSLLSALRLSDNKIVDLTPLASLNKLELLSIGYNRITSIPSAAAWLLDIEIYFAVNSIQYPPIEIVEQGSKAVAYWWRDQEMSKRALSEVKVLLVGEGAAGKTSLVKRLLHDKFDNVEPQTKGINIQHHAFTHSGKFITARIWDFGGQEIMHATHQFFMSKRSLYILVINARNPADEHYWLQHIESFGGDSPIFIVINQIDQNAAFSLDERALRRRYPQIRSFLRVSASTSEGVSEFKSTLEDALSQVEIIHTTWPQSWFMVKQTMEAITSDYISYDNYHRICEDNDLPASSRKILLQYLSDLGIVLHFSDLEWLDTQVLNPMWVTNGVYPIINARTLAESGGKIRLNQLGDILKPSPELPYMYPKDKYPYLLAVMGKFELCYELKKNTEALIPSLLPVPEPAIEGFTDTPQLRLDYRFLPPSVLPRFMVQSHNDIITDQAWRSGVVLSNKNYQARLLVRANKQTNRIELFAEGMLARDYLLIARHTLRGIHESFEGLRVSEQVPCLCKTCIDDPDPGYFDYQYLRVGQTKGVKTLPCPVQPDREVEVETLLAAIDGPRPKNAADMESMLQEILEHITREESAAEVANNFIKFKPKLLGVEIDGNKVIDKAMALWRKRRKQTG